MDKHHGLQGQPRIGGYYHQQAYQPPAICSDPTHESRPRGMYVYVKDCSHIDCQVRHVMES